MAGGDTAGLPVDRSTKPVNDATDWKLLDKLGYHLLNVRTDSRAAVCRVDSTAFQVPQGRTITTTDAQLEFGAANFNSQEHLRTPDGALLVDTGFG